MFEEALNETGSVQEEENQYNEFTPEQITEKMNELQRQLKVLEWDEKRNQINPHRKMQLEEMRLEFTKLKEAYEEKSQ